MKLILSLKSTKLIIFLKTMHNSNETTVIVRQREYQLTSTMTMIPC